MVGMTHTASASTESTDSLFAKAEETAGKTVAKSPKRSLKEPRTMYLLAIGLHIVLVIIHLMLAVVHFPNKYENRISVPLGTQSNMLSVAIVDVSQAFAVLYLAALVYLMQQLSLRRNLDIRQTFTAFHDKQAAWSGLGSAFSTLYSQRRLQTAFSGLFFIGLYIFGVSALHITTPSLLSLATSNKTSAGYANLDSSRPQYYSAEIGPSGLSDAISVLPTLPLLQKVNATAGLYGNILFDTPTQIYQAYMPFDDRPLAQEFQVPNATVFNVTCGNLAGVEQVGPGNVTSWFLRTPVRNVTDGKYNPLRAFTPYGIRFIPQEYTVQDPNFASQTLLLVASVNITDSEGNNASTFAVNPPFSPLSSDWSETGGRPLSFDPVVVACSLVSSLTSINLDAVWKNITRESIDANPRETYRVWSPWIPPTRSGDVLVQSWASIFLDTSVSSIIATTCDDPHQWPDSNQQCQMKDYLTIVEKYVNDRLQIRPLSEASSTSGNTTVNLSDLENVLEDLTAAVFWGDANFPSTALDFTEGKVFGATVNVTIYDPNAQLTINEPQLLAGLLCSVGLLCISLYLIRWPQETGIDANLNMVGLLQFTWLLGKGSDVQNNVASVTQPSTNNLRAAGMTEITLSTLAFRAPSTNHGDEES
ncbi:hypothetical protein B0H12DRAFT_159444 [Mycena haematopus]|nr:hypothetical protein B0H12DRAFT_159444 [Mycena haematopus]